MIFSTPPLRVIRPTTATWVDGNGVVQTAAVNVTRWQNGVPLIEGSGTNSALYSANLANTSQWTTFNGVVSAPTVTGNLAIAPDGTTTGAQLAFPAVTGASARSGVNQGLIVTAAVYTFSVYLRGAAGGEQLYIDVSPNGVLFYSTPVTLTLGWQRFALTTPNLTAAPWYFSIATDLRDGNQTAKPAQTIYAWGAQVELGASATSYIPTTTAAATRAADVPVVFQGPLYERPAIAAGNACLDRAVGA